MSMQRLLLQAQADGVRLSANLPFLLHPRQGNRAGVLLVHGFTASPWEMRSLGEYLAAAGFTVLGVRLPGHGTSPEDLAGRRYEEWLEAIIAGWQVLREHCPRIYGVGMSTGSLLLLLLARRPTTPLAGLVLLSPFLRLGSPWAWAAGLLARLHPFQRHPVPAGLEPYYYTLRPLRGIFQLTRLLAVAKGALASLGAPTLVVSTTGDRTIPAASGRQLFLRLGSRHKQFHLFGPEVPHTLATPDNPRQEEVFQLALNFLQRLEETFPPAIADTNAPLEPPSPPENLNCR